MRTLTSYGTYGFLSVLMAAQIAAAPKLFADDSAASKVDRTVTDAKKQGRAAKRDIKKAGRKATGKTAPGKTPKTPPVMAPRTSKMKWNFRNEKWNANNSRSALPVNIAPGWLGLLVLPAMNPPKFAVPLLIILYILWGATYLGIRVAVETIPPFFRGGGTVLAGRRGAALDSQSKKPPQSLAYRSQKRTDHGSPHSGDFKRSHDHVRENR